MITYYQVCQEKTLSEETKQMYYTPVNEFALEDAKDKINTILKEASAQNIITNEELSAMSPDDQIHQNSIVILKYTNRQSIKKYPL